MPRQTDPLPPDDDRVGRDLAAQVRRRLNALFESRLDPDTGEPYTHAKVSRVIAESGWRKVSPSTIGQTRSGENDNPTIKTLDSLARFFRVNVNYFLDEKTVDQELEVVQGLALLDRFKSEGVRSIAFRAKDLSPDGLRVIEAVLDQVRKAEGLEAPKGDI
ncbi:hypothetical protein [Streptomyces sp. Tue6028]|uniref:hypothetical protein n=1 Tax=Streptomyces sp. Tue6028 TaxID=2036037 RepID=UPI003EB8A51E